MMQPASAAPLAQSSNLRGYDHPPVEGRRLSDDPQESFDPILKGLPEINAPSSGKVQAYAIVNLVLGTISCILTCACWIQNTICFCKLCFACCLPSYRKKWVAKNLQVVQPPPTPKHGRNVSDASTAADVVIELEEGGKNEEREVGDDQTRI
ncbi:hypothetical protein FOL47_006140 [Perkinsus chesapeaki]|uniref:Uncharacterized protein n=1 Tax=Perkinsus chesapeaki TaxID=330153 RepID=A0A7J6LU29_PERCH|nr:hypothetical protein FOL47_006140 [Perkinsus chesapeaki]